MDIQQFHDIKKGMMEIENLIKATNEILKDGFNKLNKILGDILKDTNFIVVK